MRFQRIYSILKASLMDCWQHEFTGPPRVSIDASRIGLRCWFRVFGRRQVWKIFYTTAIREPRQIRENFLEFSFASSYIISSGLTLCYVIDNKISMKQITRKMISLPRNFGVTLCRYARDSYVNEELTMPCCLSHTTSRDIAAHDMRP